MYTSDKEYVSEYKEEPSAAVDSGYGITELFESAETIEAEETTAEYSGAEEKKKHMSSKLMLRYLTASVVIAAAGLIYEYFSHGVYSVFMLGAFLIPLIGGALPLVIAEAAYNKKLGEGSPNQLVPSGPEVQQKQQMIRELQLAAVATLTTGSLIQGALEIYGTTNRLMIVFPIMGAILAAVAIYIALSKSCMTFSQGGIKV